MTMRSIFSGRERKNRSPILFVAYYGVNLVSSGLIAQGDLAKNPDMVKALHARANKSLRGTAKIRSGDRRDAEAIAKSGEDTALSAEGDAACTNGPTIQ